MGTGGAGDQLRDVVEPLSSRSGILGRTIDLDSQSFTVIGVMQRTFEFPRTFLDRFLHLPGQILCTAWNCATPHRQTPIT
jgi:hypothetical protein